MLLTAAVFAILLRLAVAKLCHWGDARVGINTTYYEDTCPPQRRLFDNGTCPFTSWIHPASTVCDNFCQVRTRFFYGREQPYLSQGFWKGPGKVVFDPNSAQMYLKDDRLIWDPELVAVLNTGTTDGFNGWIWGIGTGAGQSIEVTDATCGYWTFVPILREVCGTRTFSGMCPDGMRTVENVCGLETQMLPGLGHWGSKRALAGETVFIQSNCTTYLPLNSSLTLNGLDMSMPANLSAEYADFWKRESSPSGAASIKTNSTRCFLAYGNPLVEDCQSSMREIGLGQVELSMAQNRSQPALIKNTGSCGIRLYLDEDWGTSTKCKNSVTRLELLAAAQTILDHCVDENGIVTGSQTVREIGDCGCHLEIDAPF